MQVLIVTDSFKESLDAKQVAQAIADGVTSIDPNIKPHCIPFSDGGEGALGEADGRPSRNRTGPKEIAAASLCRSRRQTETEANGVCGTREWVLCGWKMSSEIDCLLNP